LALVRSEAEWPYIKPYLAKNRRLK
jgi:hypothetical protein